MIRKLTYFLIMLLFCTGCENNKVIVSDLDEREANEIIVFLAGKGIVSQKLASASSSPGGGQSSAKWSIAVDGKQSIIAMTILNQNGLPRIKGVNLLNLFAKQGLMSSEKEETIRYQAGLAEQIATTIRKIDGVLDADVQISFPSSEGSGLGAITEAKTQKITAAVYVKHQGILDDPNSHLVVKIKRLVSGSVNGLDLNDVTVIPDKARFTDVTLGGYPETLSAHTQDGEYVSIWSIVMSKHSASRFQTLFFFLILFSIIFGVVALWLVWKFYPLLRQKGGLKALFKISPIEIQDKKDGS